MLDHFTYVMLFNKLLKVQIFSFMAKEFGSQRLNNTTRTTQVVTGRTEIFI